MWKKNIKTNNNKQKNVQKNVKFAGLSRKKLQNFMVAFLRIVLLSIRILCKTHNVVASEDLTYVINGGAQSINNFTHHKDHEGEA